MSSGQGWFESDDDYRSRVAQEANEHTIENSTGSAPSRGWFESEENYGDRIAQEANEHRIEDSTGSAPSQGWFESSESYSDRIAQEANERTIEDSTGSAPSQGWFESANDYDTRIRKEANEQIVEGGVGSAPKQGWFEGNHDYRSRVAHEAREVKARERSKSSTSSGSDSLSTYNENESGASSGGTSSDSSGGVILAVVVGLAFAALLSGKHSDPQSAPAGPPAHPQQTVQTMAHEAMMQEIERINSIPWIEDSSTTHPEWEPFPWDFEHERAPVQVALPESARNVLLQNASEEIADCTSTPRGAQYRSEPLKTFGYAAIRDESGILGYLVTGRCYMSGVGRNAYIYWLIGQRKDGSTELIEKARTWGEAFDMAFFRARIREKMPEQEVPPLLYGNPTMQEPQNPAQETAAVQAIAEPNQKRCVQFNDQTLCE